MNEKIDRFYSECVEEMLVAVQNTSTYTEIEKKQIIDFILEK